MVNMMRTKEELTQAIRTQFVNVRERGRILAQALKVRIGLLQGPLDPSLGHFQNGEKAIQLAQEPKPVGRVFQVALAEGSFWLAVHCA